MTEEQRAEARALIEPGYARIGRFILPVLTPEDGAALTRALDAPVPACDSCEEPLYRCECEAQS